MNPLVVVTDTVLADIERLVASHPPERGGALLGPVGQPVVSVFVHDAEASTTGSTFRPSSRLQELVSALEERDHTLELKGMLHSHPGRMNRPSSGDLVAYADSLRGAPWLGRFVCPIVTGQSPQTPNEVPVRSGRVSLFVSEPLTDGKSVDLRPALVRVLPIAAHATALSAALGGPDPTVGTVEVDGQVYLAVLVEQAQASFQLLLTAGYPTDAPLLLATRTGATAPPGPIAAALCADAPVGTTRQVPLTWDLGVDEDERLTTALRQATADPDAERPRAKTTAPVRDRPAATRPETDGAALTGIRQRLGDVTSSRLSSRRVVVAGAGSGGSQTAEMLARSGVEDFVLVDADVVDGANLSRSVYVAGDVGRPKVDALADRLRSVNPAVRCDTVRARVQDVGPGDLDRLVAGTDLVVAATDDPGAQRVLNHFAYARGIPAVFAGMYARGRAGEVVFTVPGLTACYRCATSTRHTGADVTPSTDYGTGRLRGEPALGADILHVVTASVKIAVGLLQVEDDETNSSKDLLVDALSTGRTYLVMSTVPTWDFFETVFADTPGQLAYQSVWMTPARQPDCPVCGDDPADPAGTPMKAPRTSALRRLGQGLTRNPAPDAGQGHETGRHG